MQPHPRAAAGAGLPDGGAWAFPEAPESLLATWGARDGLPLASCIGGDYSPISLDPLSLFSALLGVLGGLNG